MLLGSRTPRAEWWPCGLDCRYECVPIIEREPRAAPDGAVPRERPSWDGEARRRKSPGRAEEHGRCDRTQTSHHKASEMKADTQLQMDVKEELKWEPRVRDEEIGIEVRDGVVTLMGTVPDYAQRLRAERAVERVAGVRAVAQERTVKVPNTHVRSDTDLAHQVVSTLAWDTEVPDQKIKAKRIWRRRRRRVARLSLPDAPRRVGTGPTER